MPHQIRSKSIDDGVSRNLPLRDLLEIESDDGKRPMVSGVALRSDAKEGMNETALPHHIALWQPPDLPFPDQMHRFVTIESSSMLLLPTGTTDSPPCAS